MNTSPTKRGRLLAILLTMLFMYQADATIVNVATPSIRADFSASGAALELVIDGYLLASATLLITGARLGYMFGYRRVFLIGVGVFGAASLACGLAPDPVVLVVVRVIQGVGGALAFPQVLTALQLHFEEGPQRTRALSFYSIALAGGAVAGQILGGLLVSADVLGLQWRPIFLVNVPITVAVVVAGLRILPADGLVDSSKRLDLPGAAILSAAVLAIVLPLALGREAGWPAWTWACLAASMPMFAAFVVTEQRRRSRSPLINLHVIRRPAIAWGLWPQALAGSTYYALLFTLALYLQHGLGRSALVSGLTLVPWVAAFAIPGRLLGFVPARASPLLPVIGCAVLAAAYGSISASMLTGEHPEALLLGLLALGGVGLGTNFSSILVHLTASATPRYAADISGVFSTSLQIAGAIGVAAFGTLYLSQTTHPGSVAASHGFGVVTAAFAFVALIAGATAYRATHQPPQPPMAGRIRPVTSPKPIQVP
jgi:predicted MFS family arabinose efflux permease